MLAKVCSAAVNGIETYPVEVEVNAGYGDTIIVIVGLPDAAVKESRDRVMTALINSGFNFTFGQTTITPTTVGIAAIFRRKDEEEMDFAEVKGQEIL